MINNYENDKTEVRCKCSYVEMLRRRRAKHQAILGNNWESEFWWMNLSLKIKLRVKGIYIVRKTESTAPYHLSSMRPVIVVYTMHRVHGVWVIW